MSITRCACCGEVRSLDELTAVTPLAHPSDVFFVCRPEASLRLCFRAVVGPAAQFGIELASEMRAAA